VAIRSHLVVIAVIPSESSPLSNFRGALKEFHVPFCSTLDPDNRWVLLAELIPWQKLEEAYAPQFNANVGALAKPVRLAFGSLYIKQRLGLADKETVLQILENPYMQFFLGLSG
jgi:transposase, IS5 family